MAAWTISSLRRWAMELKRGKPGSRFQDHYARAHDTHGAQRSKPKAAFMWMGAAFIVLGLLFSLLPVLPGWLMILLGVAAISTQSQKTARGLDWLEVKARELIGK